MKTEETRSRERATKPLFLLLHTETRPAAYKINFGNLVLHAFFYKNGVVSFQDEYS